MFIRMSCIIFCNMLNMIRFANRKFICKHFYPCWLNLRNLLASACRQMLRFSISIISMVPTKPLLPERETETKKGKVGENRLYWTPPISFFCLIFQELICLRATRSLIVLGDQSSNFTPRCRNLKVERLFCYLRMS